eukprot:COSAG02_NODE_32_length_50374_cov_46.674013_44_plen_148_part_00
MVSAIPHSIPLHVNSFKYFGTGCSMERYCGSFWSTCLTVRSILQFVPWDGLAEPRLDEEFDFSLDYLAWVNPVFGCRGCLLDLIHLAAFHRLELPLPLRAERNPRKSKRSLSLPTPGRWRAGRRLCRTGSHQSVELRRYGCGAGEER